MPFYNTYNGHKVSATCQECGSTRVRYQAGTITCANCDKEIKKYDTHRLRKRIEISKGKKRYITSKLCVECGNSFNPSRTTQKYCGYKCSNTAGNRSRKKEVPLKCKTCKAVFNKRPSDIKLYKSKSKEKWKYCSSKCYKESVQTVSSMKKRAWNEFSKYIRERDNWTCITCGKYEKGRTMHAGHYISRRYNNTLFDERNVHAQCARCNMFYQGELHIYTQVLIDRYGSEWLRGLIEDGKKSKKFTVNELIDIQMKYKMLNNSEKR